MDIKKGQCRFEQWQKDVKKAITLDLTDKTHLNWSPSKSGLWEAKYLLIVSSNLGTGSLNKKMD